MSLLTTRYFGVMLWLWLYLGFMFIFLIGVFVYWKRELVRKKFYQLKSPEKLIKIIVHHKSGLYKIYWRVIPDNSLFKIKNKYYRFDDKELLLANDFYSRKIYEDTCVFVDGHAYNLENLAKIKNKGSKYPELHYFYNVPSPIKFDYDSSLIKFTSVELKDFKENDLFTKLLTLKDQAGLMTFMFILVLANMLGTLFIISKMMGWIK